MEKDELNVLKIQLQADKEELLRNERELKLKLSRIESRIKAVTNYLEVMF